MQTFADQDDQSNASALANVVLAGNPVLREKLKENTAMYKVVEDFLNPKFKEEVIDETTLGHLKDIMDGLKYTPQQAMDLLKIPPKDQSKYASRL